MGIELRAEYPSARARTCWITKASRICTRKKKTARSPKSYRLIKGGGGSGESRDVARVGMVWSGRRQQSGSRPRSGRGVEQPQDPFVHAKHDGGAGDGAQEMGRQAAVEADEPLLAPDELEALDEARVLGPAVLHRGLPEARAGDL